MIMAIQLHPRLAVHPGPWLRAEVVEPAGYNVTDLADHLGVSRQSMSKLLNGHQGLSAEMAIRFEKPFGLNADTLLRMQSAHGLAEARGREEGMKSEAGGGTADRAVAIQVISVRRRTGGSARLA